MTPIGAATEKEKILITEYLTVALDATLMLIDTTDPVQFWSTFKQMERYALHKPAYYERNKFSHEVERFFKDLPTLYIEKEGVTSQKFARHALRAVQIQAKATYALRRILR